MAKCEIPLADTQPPHRVLEQIKELKKQLAKAEATVEKMRHYLDHFPGCTFCNCGLAALLEALK